MVDFNTVTEFEKKIAEFFGAGFGVATDSCTHGLELCLRLKQAEYINSPRNNYVSVPMLANKLKIQLNWYHEDYKWSGFYPVYPGIYDAAVLWGKDLFINSQAMMCLSFQFQKHLSTGGRGGMILLDDEQDAIELKKMSYDGRLPETPWREQNISSYGFHYAMTPEMAKIGLDKLDQAIATPPRIWTISDWPDISKMSVFKNKR